ncbi:hypothetical protein LV779_26195 [Streptomyces thinghirensis]|nr:hypothetical protein [Streptomyces thinghirensis]
MTVARGPYELRVHRVVGAPAKARLTHTGVGHRPGGAAGLGAARPARLAPRAGDRPRPAGTAYAPWAELPRLSGDAGGTSMHVCLAALTGEPGPGPLARRSRRSWPVTPASRVVWADGGGRTGSRSNRCG